MRARPISCCFSGHRPGKLPWGDDEGDRRCLALKERLWNEMEAAYERGYRHFICGMAQGCDLYFCELALALRQLHGDVTVEAAIPCPSQAEGWPAEQRLRWQRLVAACDYETMVQQQYSPGCMQRRNRYMVDHASLLIAVHDGLPGGMTLEETLQLVNPLVDAGVDALHISAGIGETKHLISPPSCTPEAWLSDAARQVKEAVRNRVPVISVGRYVHPAIADQVIRDGKADMVAFGRALIAEPELINKYAENRLDSVRVCLGCNEGCTGMLNECRPISCALNPRTGYEDDYPMTQADAPKAVVVIGGGPAGCEAALTAAQRGHKVVLFEATSTLGGLANIAALPPGKGVFATLGTYFSAMLPRAGVDVRLNTKADADAVRALHPDHVIVATGGTPIVPRFCAGSPVVLAQDILTGAAQAGSRVLVIGGGLVGSETAEFLADKGREVTVVELRDGIALDMEYKTRQMLMPKLAALGVVCLTETEVLEIGCNGNIKVKTPYLEKELSGFDTVVVALGYRPDAALCADLAAADIDFVQVGDCKKVGKIINGVWEAFQLAYRI